MTGLIYQLKNIRRDKLCILTFLLPILVGFGIHFLSDFNFSSIGQISFGIVKEELTPDTVKWLQQMGTVTLFQHPKELNEAIKNPSTQLIGVLPQKENSIRTIRSGDELEMTAAIADRLPLLFAEKDRAAHTVKTILPAEHSNDILLSLLIVITLVTAMFMGCTFNAMSMISEKEDGILFINQVLPMRKTQYMIQKMALGFAGGTLSTAITALICLRPTASQLLPLALLIVLSSFLAALTGLFIGHFSSGLMAGIVYIKVILLAFLALPVIFYLYLPGHGTAHTLSCLLPSSAAFYGLMELHNGQFQNMRFYLLVLLAHCITWFFVYLFLSPRLHKHA